jgi:hypothetical protein
MLKKLFFLLILYAPISVFGQADSLFKSTIEHFQETFIWVGQKELDRRDNVTRDSLYQVIDFNVSISENPIYLDTVKKVINNPFFNEDFDNYDEKYKNYPVSYSVIYENNLVSLFRNGKFVVYNLNDFKRNTEFEEKFNKRKFSYHWIIDNKLYASSKSWLFSKLFVWENGKWKKAKINLPITNQSILYDDERFIVFNDCFGEWGGTVYFYDRINKDIFFTESTCANSVKYENKKYSVLAHLGHMIGSSELKLIEKPPKLTKAKKREINKLKNGEALGHSDKSSEPKKVFDLYGIQFLSKFNYNERVLYITNLNELTFITEFKGSEIQIVHPLFNNDMYTHEPITREYDNQILINLDYWGTALDREISVILIQGNKITKLDWNKKHND